MNPVRWLALILAVCLGLSSSCAPEPTGPDWELENPLVPLPDVPLGVPPLPAAEHPPTPETVRLGRWLFYDSRLSADGTVSCGTCHRPDQGFSETERVSTGVFNRYGKRKAQTFLNVAWTEPGVGFFWDGRASTLEEQALGPMGNEVEMGLSGEKATAILAAIPAYAPYFAQAFGDSLVTVERLTRAISDYERTRFAGNSAWDRWRDGDEDALEPKEKLGHDVFFGKAGCGQCHLGPHLTDGRFYNVGVGWNPETQQFADEGRAIATRLESDRGAFKTPTLRDVSRHAPFLHDGSAATLRDVVVFYNRGGRKNPWLSGKVYPLGLTDLEMDAVVAFMKALDSDIPTDRQPTRFPR